MRNYAAEIREIREIRSEKNNLFNQFNPLWKIIVHCALIKFV